MNGTTDIVERLAPAIEAILTRRIIANKMDGYTLAASRELAELAVAAVIEECAKVAEHISRNVDGELARICQKTASRIRALKAEGSASKGQEQVNDAAKT